MPRGRTVFRISGLKEYQYLRTTGWRGISRLWRQPNHICTRNPSRSSQRHARHRPAGAEKKNIRKPHDLGPLEHRIAPTDGAAQVLNAISKSPILTRTSRNCGYLQRGTGAAITMHGGGLGFGRMDAAGGRLSLSVKAKSLLRLDLKNADRGF